MSPQPGDVGVVRVRGWAGWLISVGELIYDGNWHDTHAFLVLDNDELIEAEPKLGAVIRPANSYADRNVLYSTRELSSDQRAAIVAAGRALVGIPYNWADYFALALWRFHVRFPFIKRRVNNGRTAICSQLVDMAWSNAGVEMFADGRLPGDVTPGDIARAIKDGTL